MTVITKEIKVHAGHIVTSQVDFVGKPGKCAQMAHGHTYRIIASVEGLVRDDEENDGGMIIDFGKLKSTMMEVIYDEADHAFYIWKDEPGLDNFISFSKLPGKNPKKLVVMNRIPTAENLAEYWFEKLREELSRQNITLLNIQVYETPTSSAIFPYK